MLLTLGIGAFGACSSEKKTDEAAVFPAIAVNYPSTDKDSITSDDYHGTMVTDSYRWLEYDTASNVEAWVTAQNKVTFGYLEQIPFRSKIKDRLNDIFNYPKYSSPFRVGDYYFFSKNDGLQNQSVIYYQLGLEGEAKVFLDPNKMSEDGTSAVSLLGASKDNKYMAYAINQSGSDSQQIDSGCIAIVNSKAHFPQ